MTSGDKVYVNNRDKSVALFIIGDEDITNGINILGAHIDSPRLDLKSIPLYEDSEFAYFDTHYYGGIKKYQWVTLPLALHGVVVKKTGEKVEKGEVLCTVYGDNMKKNEKSLEVLKNSVKISRKRPEPYKLIKQIVE